MWFVAGWTFWTLGVEAVTGKSAWKSRLMAGLAWVVESWMCSVVGYHADASVMRTCGRHVLVK